MKMNSKPHRARYAAHRRRVAGAATSVIVLPGRSYASHFASRADAPSNESAHVECSVVPSFTAQLRSASSQNVARIRAFKRVPRRRIAVQSPPTSSFPSVPVQSSPLPNKRLEFAHVVRPTRKSDALLLAAQAER
jgi:hypothetical protein